MKIKLNTDLKDHKKNDIVEIDCDKNGVIIDRFWRRRMKDSKIDHCIETAIDTITNVKKTSKKSEENKHVN